MPERSGSSLYTAIFIICAALAWPGGEIAGQEPLPADSGNNQFALGLHRTLSREKSGNLFTSPWSLRIAFAMTYAGAAGQTATQIAEALYFPQFPQPRLHVTMSRSLARLSNADSEHRLSVANHLWVQHELEPLPEFLQVTDTYYDAPVSRVDFRAPANVRSQINQWTEKQTSGAVKDLIPDGILSDRTRLVLSNATHFKGNWESAFQKGETIAAPFYLSATQTKKVPLMHRQATFKYFRDDDVQVLALPYVGGGLSMVVFLPHEIDGLASFEAKFDVERLRRLTGQMSPALVDVFLPSFRLVSDYRLDDALRSMGVELAFDRNRADFSAITGRRDLYLSAVLQKALVEIDEQGTEAAAGSAAAMNTRVLKLPAEFRADHPFLFIIREDSAGTILFIGRVADASSVAAT